MRLKLVIPIVTLAICCFFVVVGFSMLKNSKDCSQMVIDSYEWYSAIDIPPVQQINCDYNEQTKTRVTFFKLKEALNLKTFTPLSQQDFVPFKKLFNDLTYTNNLMIARGNKSENTWVLITNPEKESSWAS